MPAAPAGEFIHLVSTIPCVQASGAPPPAFICFSMVPFSSNIQGLEPTFPGAHSIVAMQPTAIVYDVS